MKKIAKALIMMLALSFSAVATHAQMVVRVRPARPGRMIVRRPPPPSPRHVWVDEEWSPNGRGYGWHGGYWAAPPRPGAVFIQGHWERRHRGWIWIPGFWR